MSIPQIAVPKATGLVRYMIHACICQLWTGNTQRHYSLWDVFKSIYRDLVCWLCASSSAQKRSRLNEAAKTACDLLDRKKPLINVHDTHPSLCISSISNFHAQTFLEIFCTMFSPPAGWPFCWGLYMSMAPPITEMSEKASDQIFLKLSASFWILTLPWRLWAFARKGF